MTVFIGLLRGINVGGNKKIRMSDLKALYESIGLSDVQTLLQSGNVVFSAEADDRERLAKRMEAAVQEAAGFHSEVFLRSAAEWQAVVNNAPFTAEQLAEPSKILVMILAGKPSAEAFQTLLDAHKGTEQVTLGEHALYIFYPDGMGRSKFDHPLIERKLKVSSTGRNWNTVTKLLAIAHEVEASR